MLSAPRSYDCLPRARVPAHESRFFVGHRTSVHHNRDTYARFKNVPRRTRDPRLFERVFRFRTDGPATVTGSHFVRPVARSILR